MFTGRSSGKWRHPGAPRGLPRRAGPRSHRPAAKRQTRTSSRSWGRRASSQGPRPRRGQPGCPFRLRASLAHVGALAHGRAAPASPFVDTWPPPACPCLHRPSAHQPPSLRTRAMWGSLHHPRLWGDLTLTTHTCNNPVPQPSSPREARGSGTPT